MPTRLELDDHLLAISAAGDVLRDAAAKAGLDTAVPTCPRWDVRALVTHLGMVHRWAAANLRGDKDHRTADSTAAAAAAPDLLAWFSEGVDALVHTIHSVPADVAAQVFLKDAPPPRRFWARRQAHETTIHAVDAVAASLGRWPSICDLDLPADLAADGVDELLCGFITRGSGKLRSEQPYTLAVTSTDVQRSWEVVVGDGNVVTAVRDGADPERTDADARFTGTAAQLYAGLWNRGDEIDATGRADVLDAWRSQVKVRWS